MLLRDEATRLHRRLCNPMDPEDVAVLCFDETEESSDETCALGYWARLARRHLRLVRVCVGHGHIAELSLS